MAIDAGWFDAVRAACDPVFEAADAGFDWNESAFSDGEEPTLLWEADPVPFAARYPQLEMEESYGDQWPPPCIDFWVTVSRSDQTASLDLEGFRDPAQPVALTGDGSVDGARLAGIFRANLLEEQ